MAKLRSWPGQMLVLMSLVAVLAFGCATKATTGAFVEVGRIQDELRRGVSTKMDVQRVLGSPNGFGTAIFPEDLRPLDVWYYDDVEATDMKFEGSIVQMNMRQQILLVFFEGGVFNGFMWFSNAGAAKGKLQ
jgi:hypothetical protein